MKQLTLSLVVSASLLSAVAVTPAQAQEYLITVDGTISGSDPDTSGAFGGPITNGEFYVATYLIDPTAPTTNSMDQVTYRQDIVGATLAIGTGAPVSFNLSNTNYVDADDAFGSHQYEIYGTNGAHDVLDNPFTSFTTSPNPLTLPVNALLQGTFAGAGSGTFAYQSGAELIGTGLLPDSLTISAVPLPSSIWMALAGLGMLGFSLRRRRSFDFIENS
jgi:hypothetical protein